MLKGRSLYCHHVTWQRIFPVPRYQSYSKDVKRYYCISHILVKKTQAIPELKTNRHVCVKQLQREYSTTENAVQNGVGFFSKYLSADVTPIKVSMEYLTYFHDVSGLPWWGTIILATFAVRTCLTLPLSIYSFFNAMKVQVVQMELHEMKKLLHAEADHAAKTLAMNEKTKEKMILMNERRLTRNLYIRDNCHPMKSFVIVFIQMPLFIFMSFALRHLSGLSREVPAAAGMATEGLGWCTNLTLADPTMLIPCVYGVVYLSNILLVFYNAKRKNQPMSKFMTFGLSLSGGLTVLVVPIAAIMPACMSLYWLSSSLYSLAQNFAINEPKIQKAVGLPQSPIEILEKRGKLVRVENANSEKEITEASDTEVIQDKAENIDKKNT